MNNPFEYVPDAACDEAFRQLIIRLDTLKKSNRPDDVYFCRELEDGKMIGVLIAVDGAGVRQTLYAFSGQIGERGFHRDGFVGPVFDYLQPDGYFKTKEADISRQNEEIAWFKNGPLAKTQSEYNRAKELMDTELAKFREACRLSKMERDAKRRAGITSEADREEMIRRSQFEKAELNRLKKRIRTNLEPFEADLKKAQSQYNAMKEKRRAASEALQDWLFTNFRLLNALGESRSLSEIFAETAMKLPPSGAGECCAPKLLQAAYLRGLTPISMAEYWYGRPKGGEVRVHGRHYPACRGKCLPVLTWMLKGLDVQPPLGAEHQTAQLAEPEIIFENQWFCVVNKPSGMLSVPGKGSAVSLQKWLENRYGVQSNVKPAHRLDQDTSGLVIATFGDTAFKVMQSLFATRKVTKTYVADLDGDFRARGLSERGHIELPLAPDWLDRPRQRVDFEQGKEAVTDYEFIGVTDRRSRILFHPHTGRTHQLRVHATSDLGLGMSIVGDRLYGSTAEGARLHLHAAKIEFTLPLDGRHYAFDSPTPF